MGAVQFDALATRLLDAERGGDEVGDDLLDLRRGGLGEGCFALERRACRPGSAAVVRQRPGTAVEELRKQRSTLCLRHRGEPAPALREAVVVGGELAGPGLPVSGDMGGGALHDAEAAVGPRREPALLVIRDHAVGMALQVGEGREPDAVGGRRPVAEAERREQGRGHDGSGGTRGLTSSVSHAAGSGVCPGPTR